ncbi:hypothetical protein EIB71_05160 [Kaistella daneshvariae]|uniref:Tetratricopeptide repeat protein n=1 Tax=Kaistella daneshvariae TaxID=2487074 RepID=A0ABM7C7Y6_9FLAO|nr:hypothetical protein [Kaistella daneshvariae]AZI67092.1 hypothetical protein EIB71_05160 [Kaistella daneshvariae]
MNGRILEIARNPELMQRTDLDLLKKEISAHPYLQSLRALHLLGTHRLDPENYANELSVTAAYTTDKKILYQLINSKGEEKSENLNEFVAEETDETELNSAPDDDETWAEETYEKYTAVTSKEVEPLAKVYVNGELNRILFPGEEDFMTRKNPHIDLKATLEAGKIVMFEEEENSASNSNVENEVPFEEIETEKIPDLKAENFESSDLAVNPEPETFSENSKKTAEKQGIFDAEPEFKSLDAENFSKEKIIHEDEISAQAEVIKDAEKLSFHGVDDFLPEVKIENPETKNAAKKETEDSNFSEEKLSSETDLNKNEIPEKTAGKQGIFEDENKFTSLDAENFSKEKIIHEEEISAQTEVVKNSEKLSFHGLDDFLPEVKIEAPKPEKLVTQAPKPTQNKHEEEMQRLIAEVEAKIKASKKQKTQEPEEISQNTDLNFSETQSFEVSSEKNSDEETEKTEKNTDLAPKKNTEESSETPSDWKPMSFSDSTANTLVKKRFAQNTEFAESKPEIQTETVQAELEKNIETEAKKPEAKVETEEPKAEIETEKTAEKPVESNVPSFINTWQSWLKIDRSEAQPKADEISITEIKNKVIENFIEKEPKISKLKEESDFVIKERTDDISHLMTETLANLYVEQKLYAKAIKAYYVLAEKYPDKTAYFEEKINEIKTLRQK